MKTLLLNTYFYLLYHVMAYYCKTKLGVEYACIICIASIIKRQSSYQVANVKVSAFWLDDMES